MGGFIAGGGWKNATVTAKWRTRAATRAASVLTILVCIAGFGLAVDTIFPHPSRSVGRDMTWVWLFYGGGAVASILWSAAVVGWRIERPSSRTVHVRNDEVRGDRNY